MLMEIQKQINKTIEMVCKENLWYLITDTYLLVQLQFIMELN